MDKVAIIGAGFYGLMLGKFLSEKYKVDIFESQNDVMTRASSQCQMRIHSGMMYPRDIKTAVSCIRTFKPFMLKFKDAIVDDFTSLYAIAKDSKINADVFYETQKNLGINISKVKNELFDPNMVQQVFKCCEYTFDIDIIKNTLIDQNIVFNTKITDIRQLKQYSKIFICAYAGTSEILEKSSMEPINGLRSFNTEKIFFKDNLGDTAVCVVDGDYFATMCLPKRYNGLKTLTACELTSGHFDTNKVKAFQRVKSFIPNIQLQYDSSTFCKKTVIDNHRNCYIKKINNVYIIIGGKINNVFELFNKLKNIQ